MNYLIGEYVKSLVYTDKPSTLGYLEANICHIIADTWPQLLEEVVENWTFRLHFICVSCGTQMPENIFKH